MMETRPLTTDSLAKTKIPTTDDNDSEQGDSTSWWGEARQLLQLAVPTVLVQLGFTVPSFLTASYVGRMFGPIYLDGFSLANLVVNLFSLSLLSGLYSASDTLSPQAYGAGNYREVGLVAIRGFIGGIVIIVPMCLLLMLFMEPALIALGEDPQVSRYARNWYLVYVVSLPFYALYMVTWKFLSAQNVMVPLLVVGVTSCGVILPLALNVSLRMFGFLGSAVAICIYQISQACLTILYVNVFKPHNQETWPSLAAWREALHWESVRVYFTLGMGGMLATSEWIYWEVISMAIGTLGVVELSIHTVATQAILVTFMIPLGIGIALAIRLGATIIVDVRHAKKLTAAACVSASVLFLCMSIMMYTQRETIFGFFTSDPDVIAGCHKIWPKVCFYFYHLGIYALNMGIATGLGMQWTLGVVTFFFLWIFGLPSALFFGVSVYESLDVVWDLIWPPYMFANVTLVSIFLSKDWNTISRDVRTREGLLEHSDSESDSIEATCYGSLDHSNDAMALL